MLSRIALVALAVIAYLVVTQFVLVVGILLIFTAFGWSVPGYHEPGPKWTWILSALWLGGGAAVAWWAWSRLRLRRS